MLTQVFELHGGVSSSVRELAIFFIRYSWFVLLGGEENRGERKHIMILFLLSG